MVTIVKHILLHRLLFLGSAAAEYLGISLIPRFCSLFPILLEDSLYAFDSIISKQINLDKLSGKALYFVQRSIDGLKHLLENVEKMAAKKEILVRLCRTAMKYAFLIPSIAAHNAVEDMIEVSVAKDIDSNNGNRSSFSHIGRIDSGLCFLKMKDDIPIHKVIDINIYKDVVQKCFELYPIESLRSVVDLVKENDLYSCQTIIKGALQLLKACLLMDYRPTTTEDKIKAENRDMQTEEGANRKDKLEETFLVHHLKTLFKSDRISAGKMLRELILMSDTLEIKDISTESKDSVMEIKAALRSSINALGVRKYVDDISDNYKATKPAMDESSTINNIERARSSRSVERREMPLSCVSGATPRGYHERSTTPSSRRDYYRSPRNEYVNGTREHSRNDLSADMRDRSMEPSEEGEIDVPGESSHEISSRTIRNFATVGAKEIRYRPLSRERRRRSLSRELSPRHSDRKYDQRGSSRIPLGATKALWVGGLRDRVDIQSELLDKFCSFGPVASHRFIERSGTAFINFIYIEDAVEARQKMDGSFVSGVQIRVEFKGENLPKGRRESRY